MEAVKRLYKIPRRKLKTEPRGKKISLVVVGFGGKRKLKDIVKVEGQKSGFDLTGD